jgi:hypothetical protein
MTSLTNSRTPRDDRFVWFRMDIAWSTPCPLDRTDDLFFSSRYCQLLNLHVYHRLVSLSPTFRIRLMFSMIAAYGPYAASATGGNGLARDFLAGIAAMYSTPCTSLFLSLMIRANDSLRECRRTRLSTPPRMANYHPRHLGCNRYYPNLRILLLRSLVQGEIQVCSVSRWREEIPGCTSG